MYNAAKHKGVQKAPEGEQNTLCIFQKRSL